VCVCIYKLQVVCVRFVVLMEYLLGCYTIAFVCTYAENFYKYVLSISVPNLFTLIFLYTRFMLFLPYT
jgi:hypothetical protein